MKQITCPHCADTYPDFDVAHVCSKGPHAPKLKPRMNERIKLLAEQAGMVKILEEHASEYGAGTFENTPYPELEKFAELIVRECYEHCKGQILDKEVADTNELTYNDAVGDCANGLLQHFGVEE